MERQGRRYSTINSSFYDEVPKRSPKFRFREIVRKVINNLPWLIEGIDDARLLDIAEFMDVGKKEGHVLTLDHKLILIKSRDERKADDIELISQKLGYFKAFRTYPEEVRKQLVLRAKFVYYRGGQVVVRQGRPAEFFYFIINGDVEWESLEKDPVCPDETKSVVERMTTGDCFGDIALMYNEPHLFTVTVLPPGVEFLLLTKHDFQNVLEKTVRAHSDVVRWALSKFPFYFDRFPESAVRYICTQASVVVRKANELLPIADSNGIEIATFVLEGALRVIQRLLIIRDKYALKIRDRYRLYPDQKALPAPRFVQQVFLQTCKLSRTSVFGLGEQMSSHSIMTDTDLLVLVIPRYILFRYNITNVWDRLVGMMDLIYPTDQKLLEVYIANRIHATQKKKLFHELYERLPVLETTIHSTPVSVRAEEIKLSPNLLDRLQERAAKRPTFCQEPKRPSQYTNESERRESRGSYLEGRLWISSPHDEAFPMNAVRYEAVTRDIEGIYFETVVVEKKLSPRHRFRAAVRKVIGNLVFFSEEGASTRIRKEMHIFNREEMLLLKQKVRSVEELSALSHKLSYLKPFNQYDEGVRLQLLSVARLEFYERGRVILRQGHEPDGVYFVVGGSAEGTTQSQDPMFPEETRVTTDKYMTGDIFGESAILFKEPRLRTVVASKTGIFVLILSKDDFRVSLQHTIESQWASVRWAMSHFGYFNKFSEEAKRIICSVGTLESKPPNVLMPVVDINGIEVATFIIQGTLRVIERVLIEKKKDANVSERYQAFEYQDFDASILPSEVEPFYFQTCKLNAQAVFGLGEVISNYFIMTESDAFVLIIPRYVLFRYNIANVWNRVINMMNIHYPEVKAIVEAFVHNRQRIAYRKKIYKQLSNPKGLSKFMTIHDTSVSIRATTMHLSESTYKKVTSMPEYWIGAKTINVEGCLAAKKKYRQRATLGKIY